MSLCKVLDLFPVVVDHFVKLPPILAAETRGTLSPWTYLDEAVFLFRDQRWCLRMWGFPLVNGNADPSIKYLKQLLLQLDVLVVGRKIHTSHQHF